MLRHRLTNQPTERLWRQIWIVALPLLLPHQQPHTSPSTTQFRAPWPCDRPAIALLHCFRHRRAHCPAIPVCHPSSVATQSRSAAACSMVLSPLTNNRLR
jgi:hypothetical protein